MTLLKFEGFDVNRSDAQLGRVWNVDSVVNDQSDTGARSIGRAKRLSLNNTLTHSFGDRDTYFVGIRVRVSFSQRPTQGSAGRSPLIVLRDNVGADQFSLQLEWVNDPGSGAGTTLDSQTYDIKVFRGTTEVANIGRYWGDEWRYIELGCTVHPSTGSYTVRVDGVQVATASTVDTADTGVAQADQVRIGHGNSGFIVVDDIYVCDDAGAAPFNTFLGPVLCIASLPDADGNQTDWVPSSGNDNYALVDDPPLETGLGTSDTDKVTSDTAGDIDLYTMGDLSTLVADDATVRAVYVDVSAGMETSGTRTLRPKHRDSGGSTANGTNFVVNDTDVNVFRELFTQNPSLAVAWTLTNFDASEFGVEVVS